MSSSSKVIIALGDNFTKVYNELMELCSTENFDDQDYCESSDKVKHILETHPNQKLLANIINLPYGEMEETMLMWAVWRLKYNIVKMLIERGANVHYINSYGNGVSTYWDFGMDNEKRNAEERQLSAIPIIRLLHSKGVDLSRSAVSSYGLVKRSKVYDLSIIYDELKKLGYDMDIEEDSSDY